MLQPHHSRTLQARRGIILLIVLALLALFTVVGVTFVLYASAEADSSRIVKESEQYYRMDIDPEQAIGLVLGPVIYDLPDDQKGLYSSLRGLSMARGIYGFNDLYGYQDSTLSPLPNNDTMAFNGVGRLHENTLVFFHNTARQPSTPLAMSS